MKPPLVLVDTSAWVEFFNRPDGEHHVKLSELLDLDRVAITGVIAAELLRGCRTESEMDAVESALQGVIRIEQGMADWCLIGRELGRLRRRGLTASLTDASIAIAARSSGLLLYTLDADFERYWSDVKRFA